MRLGELLSIPRLRLRFLSGADRAHLPIRSAYTTDLLCPTRYLTGGELVLTGMMWRVGPDDSETFVASLAEAGAAAVGAGTALGEVPQDLIDACHRYGLPLLEVPAETSFGVITEEVLRLLDRHRFTTIAENRDRHRRLVAEIAAGADFPEVFSAAADQVGTDAWVVSSTGRLVAAAGPRLSGRVCSHIAEQALVRTSFPGSVDVSGPEAPVQRVVTVMPVQTHRCHPLARWLLVCAGDHRSWSEETREAVAEVVSIAVLARSRTEERALNGARHAEDLPKLLAAQRYEEAAALLRAGGMGEPDRSGRIVVSAELAPTPQPPDLARRITAELLAGRSGAMVTGDNDVLAIVDVSDTAEAGSRAVERLRTELEHGARTLQSGLSEFRLFLGVGSPARRLSDVRGAAEEAQHARRLARLRGGRARVVTGAEIDTHELLLASVPEEVRATYRERLLGPLLEYDRDHRSDLVGTLERFLEHSGSWQRCAHMMHIHVNTLRYRIGRVEKLTGRDLSRLDHRLDFFLALRLREWSRPRLQPGT